jgi:outer membrane protein assembly factor BamB
MKKYIYIILALIVVILIAIAIYVWLFYSRMPNANLPDYDADKLSKYDIVYSMPVYDTRVSIEGEKIWENAQWRGENRDGVYNETGLLQQWPAGGPQLLWKYEGLGDGFTSAAIANGKLYITGLTDDVVVLYVFDINNGQLLRQKGVGRERDSQYPGPRSTVCVNDGKLYIYSAFGVLHCLDEMTLNEVWSRNLFKDFDGRSIMWGVTESPLIVGDRLFATPGGVKNNMVALDKNTGELIWSSPGEGTLSSYCSPQYIDNFTTTMVVTNTQEHIIAFNANTGEKLWSFPQKNSNDIHPNTPLYSDGYVFSTTGYKGGSVLLRLIDNGQAVEQVWKKDEPDTQIGGAVKVGEYIFASGHQNRYWYCLDWKTGEIKYKVRDMAPCNVIYADGMLYCYSEKGEMYLIKPNPEKFELVSSFKVTLGTDQHWAHPVIHEGVLYLRHGNALMAYKIQ